jgi:hypothetical protein
MQSVAGQGWRRIDYRGCAPAPLECRIVAWSTAMPLQPQYEALAFRRLVEHLRARSEVQNIDLMNLAGFCRNCLADWYREAAAADGVALARDEARELIYGMPVAQWKALHQGEATPQQQAAFAASRPDHAGGG